MASSKNLQPTSHKMKLKLILGCSVSLILLATLSTGCCTYVTAYHSGHKTQDTFNLSAVYQSTNSNSFALEGMRDNYYRHTNKPPFLAYLMIPRNHLISIQLQTNQNISLETLGKNPAAFKTGLKSKTALPSDYIKIADLPKNDLNLEVKSHHPYRMLIILLPLTVAADIVLLPIELLLLSQMNSSM